MEVKEFRGPINVNSYWDGGSRSEYAIYNLSTGEVFRAPTSHPYFDRKTNGERCGSLELNELPPDCVLVCGGTFCGKPARIRIMFRPENMVKLIPSPVELTDQQKAVLSIIRGYKAGYRAQEFDRAGFGYYSQDNEILKSLEKLGLVKMTRVGISITTSGANVR